VRRITDDAGAIDAAHRLAAIFAAGASERDRARRLPWEELERWSESGLGGITVPRAYGGADVSYATLAEVFTDLCAADPALGQIPQNHFGLLGVLREVCSEAQKQRYYAEVLAGKRLGNAGPERKSDAAPAVLQGATRLTRTAGGLRLNGHRFYFTGALFAHHVPTRRRTLRAAPCRRACRAKPKAAP
jgi:alkylation response protein AidB-like acyl-CoA dehydrogenase